MSAYSLLTCKRLVMDLRVLSIRPDVKSDLPKTLMKVELSEVRFSVLAFGKKIY